ncbi:hypothetical protein [Pseudoalteromonas sp. MMG022]|uniref:hypothetical protein n=1 Tax=Pseudoalteromonas sp. MMG022 TaxID=2909978 RepID=UPI001F1718E2|nr:hypothetical protein [Pseudoalteromonas sp. MMG022]MCF6436990.1 hypothetical protein [Pseudoalteromonas sp. MMG022]
MHVKQDPIKMVALKLTTLNWMDRVWLLRRLDPAVRKQVQGAYSAIKQLGIENPSELLAQLTGDVHQLEYKNSALPKAVQAYLARVEAGDVALTANVKNLLSKHLVNKGSNNVVGFGEHEQ